MTKETKITTGVIAIILAILVGLTVWSINSKPKNQISGDKTKLVRDTSHKTGSGPVVLVEFGDFQCPVCGVAYPEIKQLLQQYDGKVTFYFRNFPLLQHTNADAAALAAESAGAQGKFWEMHDKLYETQTAWSSLSDPTDTFVGYAQDLGLDVAKFTTDLTNKQLEDVISQDYADGLVQGVQGTPTFFINGKRYQGQPTFSGMHQKIDEILKSTK